LFGHPNPPGSGAACIANPSLRLPPDFHFLATAHAERISVGALAFDAEAIYKVQQRCRL